MGAPLWFRHDASLAHDIPGHPERPERIRTLEAALARHDWFGWDVVESPEASREALGCFLAQHLPAGAISPVPR